MIYLYTGTPGSGKSLNVARQICIWLKSGRKVISTMDINTDLCFAGFWTRLIYKLSRGKLLLFLQKDERAKNFTYINLFDVTTKGLIEFAIKNHTKGKEHQTVVILDECISIFSPEKLVDNYWLDWQYFFQYHRHFGFDLILVPQSKDLLARKIKHFCELEVKHMALKHNGIFGTYLSFMLGGLFALKTHWMSASSKTPIEKSYYLYHRIYGDMYNSYKEFDNVLAEYKKRTAPKPKLYNRKQKKAIELCNLLNNIILEKSDK